MVNSKPLLVGVKLKQCFLKTLFSNNNEKFIIMKILRIVRCEDRIDMYIFLRAKKEFIKALSRNLNKEKGVSFTVLYSDRSDHLVRLSFPREHCKMFEKCPLVGSVEGYVSLAAGVIGNEVIGIGLALSRKVINRMRESGVEVFSIGKGVLYRPLTSNQKRILYEAFRHGYYEYPRRITLKDLAAKLGLSVSAAAERLRKAEVKAIHNYILENILIEVFFNEYIMGGSAPAAEAGPKVEEPEQEAGNGH